MIRFWSILKSTLVQTIRQPVYGILIFATFVLLVIDVPLTGWTMDVDYHRTDQIMLEQQGLYSLLMAGLLIGAFSASSVLTRELEDKTALTVMSKPVSRATFLLGKFAGVTAAATAAFYLCGLAFLMTIRHGVMPAARDPYDVPVIVIGCTALALAIVAALAGNFFFRWSFTATVVCSALVTFSAAMGLIGFVGKGWEIVPFGQGIKGDLLVGMALMFMELLIFLAVAVAVSARAGQVLTLLVCLGVFFVGMMHPYLFGRWAEEIIAARVLGWVAPNLRYFDALDALTTGQHIPGRYVAMAGAYCACYTAGVLAVGVAIFQRRPLEAPTTSGTMPGAVGLLAWSGRAGAVATAITAGVMVSLPRFHTLGGLGLAAGMLAGAAALWALASCFARGLRWSYPMFLAVTILALARAAGLLAAPKMVKFAGLGERAELAALEAILATVVLVILIFPKTRRHFKTVRP